MPRYLLLIGCWLLAVVARAQAAPPMPPWQALRQHLQADTGRVNRLNRLADFTPGDGLPSNLPLAQRDSLAQQALQLALRLHYVYGEAHARFLLAVTEGVALTKQQRQAQLQQVVLPLVERSGNKTLLIRTLRYLGMLSGKAGLAYIQRALAVARASGQFGWLKRSYYTEALYYKLIVGNYYLALQAEVQELQAAQQAHLVGEEADALGDLGELYSEMGDYEQARRYFQQSLARAEAAESAVRRTFLKQANLYNLGECNRLTGRYHQALAAYQQALPLATSFFSRTIIKSSIADVYERQSDPRALPLARQVLAEAQAQYLEAATGRTLLTLGRYYLHTGLTDSAVACGQRALAMARSSLRKNDSRDAAQLLAQAYAQAHQYAPAYACLSRYLGLRDTLNSEQTARQVTAMRFTQDLARKRSQITLLTKNQQLQAEAAWRQRQLLLASFAVLLLLGGLGFVLWRNIRQKQRANAVLQRQKAALRTQRDQTAQALAELTTTQQQLIQAEKMASLGELTAGIAHEIQNPLNFVNNFSEVSAELIEELKGEQRLPTRDPALEAELLADLQQNLSKIHQHGQRAASIVRGMLEHSRASTGERQLLDLNALCAEYLRLAYHGLRTKDKTFNATLETDFALGLPRVQGVGQDLSRVLLNLFANAFYAVRQRQQAGEPGYVPTVHVSTTFSQQQVRLVVRDNGTGMPEAVKAKIFQPFFTTKPPGEGTGLGLSLSHDIIVQGHGGTLTVETWQGVGTEFTIKLPAA